MMKRKLLRKLNMKIITLITILKKLKLSCRQQRSLKRRRGRRVKVYNNIKRI